MIKAFFASDTKGGVGFNGSLPWPYDSEDLQRFKKFTTGHVVVMGSNTWIDPMMPKPLPNRTCAVVSTQPHSNFEKAHEVIDGNFLVESLLDLQTRHKEKTIWIIGGAKLLMSCHSVIQEIEHTMHMAEYESDANIDLISYFQNFNQAEESFGRNKTFIRWVRQ